MTKPKIGLALGGGVARGWAHLGVIRALSNMGIEPDVICGTSIGALVGGAYLAGHLDTLEDWARSLTKRRMLGYIDLVYSGGGLLGGRRLIKLMHEHLGEVLIEELDRPFCAVTTELATGHEIWLQRGELVESIRASFALPGVFTPVKVEDQWLIDGALVNPVPVSVCRAMGARLVIAVTLNGDTFGKSNLSEEELVSDLDEEIHEGGIGARVFSTPQQMLMRQLFGTGKGAPGIGTVMLGSLNIVMDRLSRSRMAGDPPDVLISPRCGHISLLDFDRADELVRLGRESVLYATPHLNEAMAILG